MSTLTTPLGKPAPVEALQRRALLKVESEEWDVIVVGAGPAGGLVAQQLAMLGCRTLLIDKCEFPRPKVCGGCLNGNAVAILHDLALGHLASHPHAINIERLELSCDSVQLGWNISAGAAISRATFDESLVTEAMSAGAQFLPATRATVGDRIKHSPFREVELHRADGHISAARGRVIIAADGLHQMSIRGHHSLRSVVTRKARIGLGATLPADCLPLDSGTVRMTIAVNGYVGTVRIPGNQITIAAAVDATALQATTPAELIKRMLDRQYASARIHDALHEVEWRGTGPLSRSSHIVALDDMLLVGDASGYVEPFTGEGMAWAFRSAVAAADLVTRSLRARAGSSSSEADSAVQRLARDWNAKHRQLLAAAQRRCRSIAWLLRHPRLTHTGMRLLRTFPGLADPLVQNTVAARHALPPSVRTARSSTAVSPHPCGPDASLQSSARLR